jgi:hypothetical protein
MVLNIFRLFCIFLNIFNDLAITIDWLCKKSLH